MANIKNLFTYILDNEGKKPPLEAVILDKNLYTQEDKLSLYSDFFDKIGKVSKNEFSLVYLKSLYENSAFRKFHYESYDVDYILTYSEIESSLIEILNDVGYDDGSIYEILNLIESYLYSFSNKIISDDILDFSKLPSWFDINMLSDIDSPNYLRYLKRTIDNSENPKYFISDIDKFAFVVATISYYYDLYNFYTNFVIRFSRNLGSLDTEEYHELLEDIFSKLGIELDKDAMGISDSVIELFVSSSLMSMKTSMSYLVGLSQMAEVFLHITGYKNKDK